MTAIERNAPLSHWLKVLSRWDGVLIILVGACVLLGWIIENDTLKRVSPGLVTMNPVTALGFILAGLALCGSVQEHPWIGPARRRLLAGILILIGTAKVADYALGWQFHFDEVLFQGQLMHDSAGTGNQIAPNTAFNFILGGLGLWMLSESGTCFSRWTQNLSLALLYISLVSLVGYLYGAHSLYRIGIYTPMALHAATCFCLLAVGLLLTQADGGVVALFVSKTPGGLSARRLLPVAFGLPIALGAVRLWGERRGWYPPEIGVTVMIVAFSAIFAFLIWKDASLTNRMDRERRRAEDRLRRAHDELERRVQERTAALHSANETLRTRVLELQKAHEKIGAQAILLNQAQDAILVIDAGQRLIFWNKGAERVYGWTEAEAMGKKVSELLFSEAAPMPEACGKIPHGGQWTGELRHTTKTGREIVVESRWTAVDDVQGNPGGILIIDTDITDKKDYETQLLRSQRMESLGALASGIAHDLNNTLTPILVGVELLRETTEEEERQSLLQTIHASAERGTAMVKQLLGFTRGSSGKTVVVPLRPLVEEMAKIIRDTFPKSVSLRLRIARGLSDVSGNVTELHQVLLNLCVNARDAMPQGGTLTLATGNVTLDREIDAAGGAIPPGPYVLLAVEDTGTGIPAGAISRIFEPFFTTKAQDKGTGLGLSTVVGIVKRHHAFLRVASEVGKGTRFEVYLPPVLAAQEEASLEPSPLPSGKGELILVVDDEEAVRELNKMTLEHFGYRVITAINGLEGVARFEEHQDEIKVLVSDTDMPFLDGIGTIQSIQKIRPGIPVVIASGSKPNAERMQLIDMERIISISKPYTIEQLLKAVAAHVVNLDS